MIHEMPRILPSVKNNCDVRRQDYHQTSKPHSRLQKERLCHCCYIHVNGGPLILHFKNMPLPYNHLNIFAVTSMMDGWMDGWMWVLSHDSAMQEAENKFNAITA